MSFFNSDGSSDAAGPSREGKFSARFSDTGSMFRNAPSTRSTRIKAWLNSNGKERDHLRPSFSRQLSPASSPQARVEESVHRAAVKARVRRAGKDRSEQSSNAIVRGFRSLFSRITSTVAKKCATSDDPDEMAECPPDSSSVAPSCETFVDPDDSVWDHEIHSDVNSERPVFRRIPNCRETDPSPSVSIGPDTAVDQISIDSVQFLHHENVHLWRGIRMNDYEYYFSFRERRDEVWKEHKEWLVKRYGTGQAEAMIKLIESTRYSRLMAKRILRSTLNLRDKEEHLQFLLEGARAALSALMERDMRIWESRRTLSAPLPVSSDSSNEGDGRASSAEYQIPYAKFNRYESAWESLLDPASDLRLSFRTVPWPTTDIPRSPHDILIADIWDFLLDGYFGLTEKLPRYCKLAADWELEKWSPGQVMASILPRVHEEERDAVRMGADIVFKGLIVLASFSVVREDEYRASLASLESRQPRV